MAQKKPMWEVMKTNVIEIRKLDEQQTEPVSWQTGLKEVTAGILSCNDGRCF